ncbi:uncharacterized protein LOC127420061 isoform X2 [Myxocyprinus asiaticus]|uniref:uncharacterized protein LOC127420061 isoform X2 n=1 Tax=Myxocyprinus asiaticus TaxID=70543 RepID=UPI002223293D|nr:uncharacterized protein LOC127420061 isoform X2 [Myxocyprinus asiaticus]
MAVLTPRMNELWKRMALVLVFAILLLYSCQAQDPQLTSAPAPSTPAESDLASTTPNVLGKTEPAQQRIANLTESPIIVITTVPSSPTVGATIISQTSAAPSSVITAMPRPHQSETPEVVQSSGSAEADVKNKLRMENSPISNQESFSKIDEDRAKSSPAVLVSVLITGLLLAAIIVGTYYFKCHRRTSPKGVKLAESFIADEENQGNTLVSMAPLNQPELQQKPSLNGESPETVKTQTPPAATNGHSTTKTADTEL